MDNERYYHDLNRVISVLDRYYHDMACTFTWLWSPNQLMGNAIPFHMIENNKTEALIEFIVKNLHNNTP